MDGVAKSSFHEARHDPNDQEAGFRLFTDDMRRVFTASIWHKFLAFCMGTQDRLGANSPVLMLNQEMIEFIAGSVMDNADAKPDQLLYGYF